MADPRLVDWQAAIRILRYLGGTKKHGLHLSRNGKAILEAHADADYATTSGRRKITGYCVMLEGDAMLSWRSMQQSTLALSIAEAEFVSQSEVVFEVLWLHEVLSVIGRSQSAETVIYQDNTSAISWRQEGLTSRWARHIAVRYYFLVEHTRSGEVKLQFVGSNGIRADFLTKPLPGPAVKNRVRGLVSLKIREGMLAARLIKLIKYNFVLLPAGYRTSDDDHT